MTDQIETDSNDYMPPAELRLFVQTMLSKGIMGNKEAAQKACGVDRGRFYYHFRKNPKFRRWYSEQCEQFLAEQEATVSAALIRNIIKGDSRSLRMYYQLKGRLKNEALIDARTHIGQQTNETHITNIHDNSIVVRAIDSLSEEDKDKLGRFFIEQGWVKEDGS